MGGKHVKHERATSNLFCIDSPRHSRAQATIPKEVFKRCRTVIGETTYDGRRTVTGHELCFFFCLHNCNEQMLASAYAHACLQGWKSDCTTAHTCLHITVATYCTYVPAHTKQSVLYCHISSQMQSRIMRSLACEGRQC